MDNLLDFVNDKCLIEIGYYDDFKKNFFDKLIIELKDFNLDMYDEYSYTSCYKYLNFVINSEYSDMDGLFVFLIGCMYKNGEYFKQDYQEAIKYYKMAIEKGHDIAMNNLGRLYLNGFGVEKNYLEAVKYFKMAIEKGNDIAMNNFGNMYHNGFGVEKNYTEAIKYYKMAIEKGNDIAMRNLGHLYYDGFGTRRNYTEAIKYYKMAIEKGNHNAIINLGDMYYNGFGVEKNYTEAIKYYKMAIEKGNDHAMNVMGWMYQNSIGLRRNYHEAIKYYKMAYEKGNNFAMNNLGNMYRNGEGIKRDYHEAVKYYKMAIKKGVSYAMNSFYNIYNGRYYLSANIISYTEVIEYCKIYINVINDESEIIKTMDKMFEINKSINNSDVYIDLINLCDKFKLDDYKMKIMKYILKNSTIKRLRIMIKYISCYEKLEDICSKNKIKMLRLLLADEQEQFYTNISCDLSTTVNRYTSAEIFSFI